MALFTFLTSPPQCTCDLARLALTQPTPELFDKTAKELAEEISQGAVLEEREERQGGQRRKVWQVKRVGDRVNKPAQIRKFYDELCMWVEKTQTVEDLERNLPFIKMMNAKVAYARGRELVDDKFVAWFAACLEQIRAADETGLKVLENFRTLFEAFLGFYKVERPK